MSALDDDLREVDPELADYVEAFRDVETPAPPAVDATWENIARETRRPFPVWIPVVLAAAAAVIAVALMNPGSTANRGDAQPAEQVPYRSELPATAGEAVDKNVPAPRPSPKPEWDPVPVPVPVPETTPEPNSKPQPQRATPKSTPDVAEPPTPSALAQETALIGQIRRAQAAGRHAEVVSLTEDHAKRFPRGSFADERSLAQARALCRLGRTQRARNVSDRFVKKHPKSHLVAQFQAICAE